MPQGTRSRSLSFAAALAATLTLTPIAQASLVGLWEFDNAANIGQATVGSDLTANETAQYTASGNTGGGLLLDGANNGGGDYLFGATALPTGDSSYTVSAWFNGNAFTQMGIVGWGNYGTSGQVNATRTGDASVPQNLVNYGWGGPNDLTASTGQTINDSQWYHVTAVYDSATSTKTLYFNGNPIGSLVLAGNLNVSASNFRIGSTNFGELFNGTLDTVAIFNHAVASTQVASLYNGSAFDPDLAHRYSFTGYGVDAIGSADLGVIGGASFGPTSLDLNNATPGGGGNNDQARATGAQLSELAAPFDSSLAITVEAWFNQDTVQTYSKLLVTGADANNFLAITPAFGGGNTLVVEFKTGESGPDTVIDTGVLLANDTDYYVAVAIDETSATMTVTYGAVGGALSTFSTALVNKLSDLDLTGFSLGSPLFFGDQDWDGQVDEFRIWQGALDASQIAKNFAAGADTIGIPAPAALPAGLAMLGMIATRRRRST